MDPKSRPIFEDLVLQFEQLLTIDEFVEYKSTVDRTEMSTTSHQKDLASHEDTSADVLAKTCQIQKQSLQSYNCKLDNDVYLVAGCSPSEKARCHYVQGHTKDKAIR